MKYLFFDIECSNCFNDTGKMCEFGYVLTDENFNILRMDDIPMSPGKGRENRFHLRDRMKREDLNLAYDEDYYFECEEFPHFYESIKRLITDKDTICFAYSADNDIRHLYSSCKRYGLKPFDYICYDIQKLADDYLKSKSQTGLKKAYISIVGLNKAATYQEHLARDDARMTADIFEAICTLKNKSSLEILEEYKNAKYSTIEFINDFLNRKHIKENKMKAHKIYKNEALNNAENAEKPEYFGKRYGISASLKTDPESVSKIIKSIKGKGNIIVDSIALTDVFVVLDEKDKERLERAISESFSGEYVFVNDLK